MNIHKSNPPKYFQKSKENENNEENYFQFDEVVEVVSNTNSSPQRASIKHENEYDQSGMNNLDQESVEKLIIAFLERRQIDEARHLSDNAVVKDRAKFVAYVEKGLQSCRRLDGAAFAELTELRQRVPNWANIEAKISQDHNSITVQDAVLFKNAALYAYKFSLYNLDHNMNQRKQALEVLSDSCELFGNHMVQREDRRPNQQQQGLYDLMRLKLIELVAVYRLQLIICILALFAVFLLVVMWVFWCRHYSVPVNHGEGMANTVSR